MQKDKDEDGEKERWHSRLLLMSVRIPHPYCHHFISDKETTCMCINYQSQPIYMYMYKCI